MRRIAVAAACLAFLAACGSEPDIGGEEPPSPILFEIASAEGQVEGWLFGTIHALPDGVEWRTATFDQVEAEADRLVVEVIFPADANAGNATYFRYANSSDQPPLSERVPATLGTELGALLDAEGVGRDFSGTETWAAAISLARLTRIGESENGVDRALLESFADRPTDELEGLEQQFAIFDALPESEQRDMLAAVVTEYRRAKADPARLIRIWRRGDMQALEAELRRGMLADRELRQALLTDRNAAWVLRLQAILGEEPKPLIAVGTAHLVGDDSVTALLEREGYAIRRLQ